MNETVEFLAKHGYWVLFASVLGRQACVPVPANLLLLAGGALAGLGKLSFAGVVAFSVAAFLLADLAWYEAGRRWGSRTLHLVCGATRDPGSCVDKIYQTFSRYGVKTLLVSKFIIGLDAVAAPMAGISGTDRPRFLVFDALGAILWASAYTALGYVFSNQLDRVVTYSAGLAKLVLLAAVAVLVVFIVLRLFRLYRFLAKFRLAGITPDQLRDKLLAREEILILDLQGRAKQVPGLVAIPGAIRVDPYHLRRYRRQYRDVDLPTNREVILYSASPSEFTSARVALELRRRGFENVRPLVGDLQAWRDRSFPVTPSAQMLSSQEQSVYVLREILQYSLTNTAQLLKTSTANVDQLLERAKKRIANAEAAQLLWPISCDLERRPAKAIPDVPATTSFRQGSTPK
jgi:membrane protein DedA with SNARE-associated domain/rhodanese-related sulfurtransferase